MSRFKQFHDPELSIWQAAVGEVEAQAAAGTQVEDVGAAQVRGATRGSRLDVLRGHRLLHAS